jgi:hypothetical protein
MGLGLAQPDEWVKTVRDAIWGPGHDGCPMKRNFRLGLALAMALAAGAARAQDFTAGKTPAQLFGSDCSACHRSTAGLAKNRDVRTLAAFLREHYTTKPETAASLAAYVMTGAAGAPGERRGRGAAAAANDAAAISERGSEAAEHGHGTAREDLRRRRSVSMSGDGEKPVAPRKESAAAQRPAAVAAARTNPPIAAGPAELSPNTPTGQPTRDEDEQSRRSAQAADAGTAQVTDPIARLKAYAASGLDLEATASAAAALSSGKPRGLRDGGAQQPAPVTEEGSSIPTARAGGDAPLPSAAPAPASASIAPAAALPAAPAAAVSRVRARPRTTSAAAAPASVPAARAAGASAMAPTHAPQ